MSARRSKAHNHKPVTVPYSADVPMNSPRHRCPACGKKRKIVRRGKKS